MFGVSNYVYINVKIPINRPYVQPKYYTRQLSKEKQRNELLVLNILAQSKHMLQTKKESKVRKVIWPRCFTG